MKPNSGSTEKIEDDKAIAIKNLIAKAKKEKSLTYKDIIDHLGEIDLEPEEIDILYQDLEDAGIEIIEDIEDEEDSDHEDNNQSNIPIVKNIAVGDPVKCI